MIKSLTELIQFLQDGKGQLNIPSERVNLSPTEFKPYTFWHPRHYTRNLIALSPDFELLLMCWEPGQGTYIHNHGGVECWVYLLEGELHEEVVRPMENLSFETVRELTGKTGDLSHINDEQGWHRMQNRTDRRSLSLHVYSKPIASYMVYNETIGKLEERCPLPDSIAGKLTGARF